MTSHDEKLMSQGDKATELARQIEEERRAIEEEKKELELKILQVC